MDDSAKVSFDDNAMEDIAVDFADNAESDVVESTMQAEVEKFDTSNTDEISQKLSKLYSELDTLVIDEDKLRELTTVKSQAKAIEPISFRSMLYLSSAVLVTALLLFMVIYNFVVINGLNGSIKLLEADIASSQSQLSVTMDTYDTLTNEATIRQELANLGFGDMSDSDIMVLTDVANKVEVPVLEGETNWFDGLCNIISQVFNG